MGNYCCKDHKKEEEALKKVMEDVHRVVSKGTNNPVISTEADVQLITGVASVTDLDYSIWKKYTTCKEVVQHLNDLVKRNDYILVESAVVVKD